MKTSKIFSLIAFILLLAASKAYTQVPDEFKKIFEQYGYEFAGMKQNMIEDAIVIDMNFQDKDGNILKFSVSTKVLDVEGSDPEDQDTLKKLKVLHSEKINIMNQEMVAVATRKKQKGSPVRWIIGPVEVPSGDFTMYGYMSGEGKKSKVMGDFNQILTLFKGEAEQADEEK